MANNPYDPNQTDYSPQTPPLDEAIRLGIDAALLNTRTWQPGQVTQVLGPGKVVVQPMLQRLYAIGTAPVTLKPVQNVMVAQPRGANYYIKLPVAVGDTGILLTADRSLDNWSVQGGIVDPQDTRHHDLTDSIFIPGLYPFSSPIADDTTDLVIKNGNAQIRVQAAGTFQFKNQSQELINLLDQLLNILINETFTLTFAGPEPFIASTNALLTTLRQNLDTLMGEG